MRNLASYSVRISRETRLRRLYEKYRHDSMVAAPVFLDNLRLVSPIAADPAFSDSYVVECGTWRGGMAAALMELGGTGRRYAFFDSFAGLPPAKDIDGPAARAWQSDRAGAFYHDNCTASRAQFETTIHKTAVSTRAEVFEGLFEDTLAGAELGPISILRLDGDWYGSTLCCLQALWHRVTPGGLVIVDDYGLWDGCTRAVHTFLASTEASEPIEHFGKSQVPFLRKRAAPGPS